MGAFIAVFLVTRLARIVLGRDKRGSVLAFVVGALVTFIGASFGFSSDAVAPVQLLPSVALGYGKFCVALLLIDLDTARRMAAAPSDEQGRVQVNFKVTPAWFYAAGVIAIGALASSWTKTNIGASSRQSAFSDNANNSTFDSSKAVSSRDTSNAAPATSGQVIQNSNIGNSLSSGQAPAQDTWVQLSAKDAHVKVWLPGAAQRTTYTSRSYSGRRPITGITYEVDLPYTSYAVTYMKFDNDQIDRSATVERMIESTRDGMLGKTAARLIGQRWSDYQNWPSLDFSGETSVGNQTAKLQCRVILQGRRMYNLLVVNGIPADIQRFLNSVELAPPADAFRLPHRQTEDLGHEYARMIRSN